MLRSSVREPFGIGAEVLFHVFVDQRLQVDTQRAIGADDLIAADAGIGRHISVGIGNANVSGIVADGVMRALDGRGGEAGEEFLVRIGVRSSVLREVSLREQEQDR